MSENELVPTSSASHGITASQDVARDVAERIDEMERAVGRSRVGAYLWFTVPIALTVGLAVADAALFAVWFGYTSLSLIPIGIGIHLSRRKALKAAQQLRRDRDVAWVSRKDGLVFFGDDGLFIEKRGGFKVYGAGLRRFTHVTFDRGTLALHGRDAQTGASWTLDLVVPAGWNDADTERVQQKIAAFVPEF